MVVGCSLIAWFNYTLSKGAFNNYATLILPFLGPLPLRNVLKHESRGTVSPPLELTNLGRTSPHQPLHFSSHYVRKSRTDLPKRDVFVEYPLCSCQYFYNVIFIYNQKYFYGEISPNAKNVITLDRNKVLSCLCWQNLRSLSGHMVINHIYPQLGFGTSWTLSETMKNADFFRLLAGIFGNPVIVR